jgi:hypothetical protein
VEIIIKKGFKMNIKQLTDLLEKTAAHIEILENENRKLKEEIEKGIPNVNLEKEASFEYSPQDNDITLGQPSSYTPGSSMSSYEKLENFLNTL